MSLQVWLGEGLHTAEGRAVIVGEGLQWQGGGWGCNGYLFPICEVSSDDTNSNSQNLTV